MTNKLLSIIFLHWVEEFGPLQETLVSLESILKYTTVPYELIIVNNGSTVKTNREIKTLIENYRINGNNNPINYKYVNLKTNQGVSKGFNAGLKKISDESKYISIYSNDWVCSPNWAELMIEELEESEKYGFMTACTNHGAGSMCYSKENPIAFSIPEIKPTDPELFKKVELVARHTIKARGSSTFNTFPAMGWIMKREVFDKVGLMDERIYCANDVAYAKRAFNLGYYSKTAWAPFIYHFWHSSFSQINDRETYSFLRPKDKADLELIKIDEMYNK